MGNIAKVKKIMCKSSMPLEMTVAEFVEQASDTNWECFDGLKEFEEIAGKQNVGIDLY